MCFFGPNDPLSWPSTFLSKLGFFSFCWNLNFYIVFVFWGVANLKANLWKIMLFTRYYLRPCKFSVLTEKHLRGSFVTFSFYSCLFAYFPNLPTQKPLSRKQHCCFFFFNVSPSLFLPLSLFPLSFSVFLSISLFLFLSLSLGSGPILLLLKVRFWTNLFRSQVLNQDSLACKIGLFA